MIITIELIKELFRGFTVHRWNDKIRPVDLIEIDKHAHKMFIAYCLGKFEEDNGRTIDWNIIIKNGIFELLRRIVLSDIKSPIYYLIKQENKRIFNKLNQWVFEQLAEKINDSQLQKDFYNYLFEKTKIDKLSQKILDAAHKYSSYWEFLIIKNANPFSYQIIEIERSLLNDLNNYLDLVGMRELITRQKISDFVDLFGQLRFQTRWSQIPRVPKTSVLGHSMLVATLSYFFSIENKACSKRIYNNFFGGLFHDLTEAVTRDIISPVKESSKEFNKLIFEIGNELAEKEIFPLVQSHWVDELKYFMIYEFKNKVNEKHNSKKLTTSLINKFYNEDKFSAYDGALVKAADQLAAFLEAWYSTHFGIKSDELFSAINQISSNYSKLELGELNLSEIFSGFLEGQK
ncbi:MAG: HD domain-containing protein [Candidatus Kapabacteria bacterium]|nr:HD domain-containing protein [Candidatus Kapabacteria bacterium]